MTIFTIRFLICNLFISAIITALLMVKYICRNHLSSRMQYNLWFIMLGLLAIPFLPIKAMGNFGIASLFDSLKHASTSRIDALLDRTAASQTGSTANWMNDFTLSVSRDSSAAVGGTLCALWITGMIFMVILILKSNNRLRRLKYSALPLQNEIVRQLYQDCLNELNITKKIPIYSTVFLKSPIIVGLLKPSIFLPTHLLSGSLSDPFSGSPSFSLPAPDTAAIRYMLLHELQHFKHKDALANYLMNMAKIIYWFNPLVWYALKEMQNDREIACDSSVLDMLEEESYENYGDTLINFAEKVSLTPFPFAAGLGGNKKQIKRRILNIASYEKLSVTKKVRQIVIFGLIAALLTGLAPLVSTYAADESRYNWDRSKENISDTDSSSYFDGYDGSFVLYDLEGDSWTIYNENLASIRVAPNSTYKIYDALFGLETGAITPQNSMLSWDQQNYPFETWNTDQTLQSAMQNSVNWYFQAIDQQLGRSLISQSIKKLGYGNENTSGDLSSYWLESSLKISPVEQVELLTKLHNNTLPFAAENMNAVKESLLISSSETGSFYGKTGTGRVNEQDINGWFVGYVEKSGHTYLFAVNIQGTQDATGSKASNICLDILSDLNIWKQ